MLTPLVLSSQTQTCKRPFPTCTAMSACQYLSLHQRWEMYVRIRLTRLGIVDSTSGSALTDVSSQGPPRNGFFTNWR